MPAGVPHGCQHDHGHLHPPRRGSHHHLGQQRLFDEDGKTLQAGRIAELQAEIKELQAGRIKELQAGRIKEILAEIKELQAGMAHGQIVHGPPPTPHQQQLLPHDQGVPAGIPHGCHHGHQGMRIATAAAQDGGAAPPRRASHHHLGQQHRHAMDHGVSMPVQRLFDEDGKTSAEILAEIKELQAGRIKSEDSEKAGRISPRPEERSEEHSDRDRVVEDLRAGRIKSEDSAGRIESTDSDVGGERAERIKSRISDGSEQHLTRSRDHVYSRTKSEQEREEHSSEEHEEEELDVRGRGGRRAGNSLEIEDPAALSDSDRVVEKSEEHEEVEEHDDAALEVAFRGSSSLEVALEVGDPAPGAGRRRRAGSWELAGEGAGRRYGTSPGSRAEGAGRRYGTSSLSFFVQKALAGGAGRRYGSSAEGAGRRYGTSSLSFFVIATGTGTVQVATGAVRVALQLDLRTSYRYSSDSTM